MTRSCRARPEVVRMVPMPAAGQVRACPRCYKRMAAHGRYAIEVDGAMPCDRCVRAQLGDAAAGFMLLELEALAARVATLPRGGQRQTAARALYDAAGLILDEFGGRL